MQPRSAGRHSCPAREPEENPTCVWSGCSRYDTDHTPPHPTRHLGKIWAGAVLVTMTDKLIERNPNILSGTPVFFGTRVPVRILMEHLESGDRLDEFLDDYPTVSREQAIRVLERARTLLVGDVDKTAA